MIYGNIQFFSPEAKALSPILTRGLAYLKNTDFASMAPGRYEIQGDTMFALVSEYETQPKAQRRPERHEKYIDIQFLISGGEAIGYSLFDETYPVLEDNLAAKDIVFYAAVENEIDLPFCAGAFAVFFPHDVHRPCCQWNGAAKVKKVVLKIRIDAL